MQFTHSSRAPINGKKKKEAEKRTGHGGGTAARVWGFLGRLNERGDDPQTLGVVAKT